MKITDNRLTVRQYIEMSDDLYARWQAEGVVNANLTLARMAILSGSSSYRPELIKEVILEYIDRVEANYQIEPARESWWDEEYWQKYLAGRDRQQTKFQSQVRSLVTNDMWWTISCPGHLNAEQIFRYLVKEIEA